MINSITTRYLAFRNTAFRSIVALYLIGVPNMQYDDVRLDSVKTVFRVVSPEYHVTKSNFKGLVHIMVGTMIISAPIIS